MRNTYKARDSDPRTSSQHENKHNSIQREVGGTFILRDLQRSQDMAVRFLSSIGTRRRFACWPVWKEFVGLDTGEML